MWGALSGLIKEIKRCEAGGATMAAVTMVFVGIDVMAYLALPIGRESQRRADFIAWVDAYMRGNPSQPYQYRGLDVYGARCSLLHAFGSEADFHQDNPDAKIFGYHDGGMHALDLQVSERLIIIGIASFLDDFIRAVGTFLEATQADLGLRARVEGRLPKVLNTFSVKQ